LASGRSETPPVGRAGYVRLERQRMGEGGDIPCGNRPDLVSLAIHPRSSQIRLPPYIEQITTAPALIAHCDDIGPVSLVFWHASHDDGVYHL
jgi:hypothetical protein